MENKKSIVIYGGSFNPPHNMHFSIAEQALKQYEEIEKVIFIPINNKYSKPGIIENEHRYQMLKSVINKKERFELSDVDMYGEKSVLTVNTLEQMEKYYENREIWVLVGSDNLKKIHTWYRAEDLLRNYKILVMERDEDSIEDIINSNELLKNNKSNIKKLNSCIKNNLSATYIRKQIEEGNRIEKYVPKEVLEYIQKNKLYKA